ncbi:polysaccharide pyruvyl transferase family protein [Planctomycetes bacterium K23_9]|uniref:Polysaccharide pyruvyl transferase n=1 Tax=Stieleria marina TaxID=1930275 RepID=A0A517NM89_9BACT|nr:Polysaccharide pyruvyl transferase [Planctomycetes bacterium K23_9]
MHLNRRDFVGESALALSLLAALPAGSKPKRILLRSSWQTVNIGDIAHTPGVLRLIEQYLPDAEVWLYPSNLKNGVDAILQARFPKVRIAKKGSKELEHAYEVCDFMLHGSGPYLVGEKQIIEWQQKTDKPFGVYGITFARKDSAQTSPAAKAALEKTISVLSDAKFVFFRDSKSLALAKELGATCPVMEFGPDGAFACDLRDDVTAQAFLKNHDLQTGKFLCCIPRLRYTPYWTIPEKNRPLDPIKHQRNEQMKEHDHAPLRQAIIEVVQQTDLKVLICPEDKTQMAVGREMLLDKLPQSVLDRVVWRPNYWLTGEAVSVYTSSVGLFGNEMHSPIMCIGHGVPAVVCRFAEQTHKGLMWQDIGLDDWLFDLDDETQVQRIVPTVLDIAKNPDEARAKAAKARAFVEKRQRETMDQLNRAV